MSQSGNTLNSECFWILDSGASDHVCPHIKFFTSIHMIKPISVKFPDGSTLFALYSRSIHFSEHLHLHDVLYIPQFHFNLISVYQLTRSLNCRVIFSYVFCGIQDPHTQQMIERVEMINNLYVLKQTPNQVNSVFLVSKTTGVNNKNKSDFFDIWHFRLGHPSINVLQHVSTVFPYV